MDFIQGHVPDVMVLLFLYTPIKMLVRNTTHAFIFAWVFLSVSEVITSTKKKKKSDINDMITCTPRKAFSSETNLVHCLICAESLENTDRIAVFGRSQWDLRGDLKRDHFQDFRRRVAADKARVTVRLYKEMFSKVEKG